MTREQIEARFEREVPSWEIDDAGEGPARVVDAGLASEFVVSLVAELQAPPTGEDVEKAWANWERRAVAWNCECEEGTLDGAIEAEGKLDAAVRAYGAACRAAGRAEAMAVKEEVLARLDVALSRGKRLEVVSFGGRDPDSFLAMFGQLKGAGANALDAIAAAIDRLEGKV